MRSSSLIVVGGGIVGLAVARAAADRWPSLKVIVLEKESTVAAHQTGRNSGVIHSGIYYKPGSLKARLCVEGAAAMLQFCREHGIPYQVCGKVIVATDASETPALEELYRRGTQNGVSGVRMIGPQELRELEPHCAGIRAVHVPGSAITDYSAVARRYAELLVASGGELRTATRVNAVRVSSSEVTVETTAGDLRADFVINCAGLHSDRVARSDGAQSKEVHDLQIVPFRGEYYELAPESRELVRGLIYPVPDPRFPFLGVHFTRKISGGVEAGPNAVLALKREGYTRTSFSMRDVAEMLSFPGFWRMAHRYWQTGLSEQYRSLSKAAFTRALQKLVPEIRESDLHPGGSGVRAQAVNVSGALVDDFYIVTRGRRIDVLNVPSPAATASLAIAKYIVNAATQSFGFDHLLTSSRV